MNLSSRRERSFFLAQAFTPGNRESNGFFSPLQGACAPTSGEAPWKGATQRVGVIQPRRKRLGYGKGGASDVPSSKSHE